MWAQFGIPPAGEPAQAAQLCSDAEAHNAECLPYLRDGESVVARLARYHDETQGVLGELAEARADAERLRAALVGMVGVDTESELKGMALIIEKNEHSQDEKKIALDAVAALMRKHDAAKEQKR